MPNSKELDELALKIQETAQTLFDEHGVEEVSMHRIAQETGIGQGTLYRRYPSKSKLCLSLMENKFNRLTGEIEAYLLEAKELPIVERLSEIMKRLLNNLDKDLQSMKTLLNSPRLEEATANLCEIPPFIFIRGKVHDLLQEAQQCGELRPLDLDFTSSFIATSLKPELVFYLHDMGYTTEQIAEKYCECAIKPLFTAQPRS
ncbi:TetR/AcrR family transcriptional regulator [Paenibacillus pinistramenti]|uniref:TetR/AcrR family transcriptional regulator n=1 Tax=Paenibacillus pinistramenti TaxID=1768003 RepID=UPI001396B39A|nr:TetR/AcrR family transcriptional regulator [Paenibacillus pinistramenti]